MENRIKLIRAKTGLSQMKFAEVYHIPMRTLQDWEREVRTPPNTWWNCLSFV